MLNLNDWFAQLPRKENEYVYIIGKIEARRPRAIAFNLYNKRTIWIPLSVLENMEVPLEGNGLWIKEWWLEKQFHYLEGM